VHDGRSVEGIDQLKSFDKAQLKDGDENN